MAFTIIFIPSSVQCFILITSSPKLSLIWKQTNAARARRIIHHIIYFIENLFGWFSHFKNWYWYRKEINWEFFSFIWKITRHLVRRIIHHIIYFNENLFGWFSYSKSWYWYRKEINWEFFSLRILTLIYINLIKRHCVNEGK